MTALFTLLRLYHDTSSYTYAFYVNVLIVHSIVDVFVHTQGFLPVNILIKYFSAAYMEYVGSCSGGFAEEASALDR